MIKIRLKFFDKKSKFNSGGYFFLIITLLMKAIALVDFYICLYINIFIKRKGHNIYENEIFNLYLYYFIYYFDSVCIGGRWCK